MLKKEPLPFDKIAEDLDNAPIIPMTEDGYTIANWQKIAKRSNQTFSLMQPDLAYILTELEQDLITLQVIHQTDRSYLAAHPDEVMNPDQIVAAVEMLTRRMLGEPMAYVLGHKDFFGRTFSVDERVLVPRPETESIVELVIDHLKHSHVKKPWRLLDVGTGSGCIATTLYLELPTQLKEVIGVDISLDALAVACDNAESLGIPLPNEKLHFCKSDLLTDLIWWGNPATQPNDGTRSLTSLLDHPLMLTANLPYVNEDWSWLSDSINYEPEIALYADDDGMAVIKRLLRQVKVLGKKAKHPCLLCLEADSCQHRRLINFAQQEIGFKHLKTDGYALLFDCRI